MRIWSMFSWHTLQYEPKAAATYASCKYMITNLPRSVKSSCHPPCLLMQRAPPTHQPFPTATGTAAPPPLAKSAQPSVPLALTTRCHLQQSALPSPGQRKTTQPLPGHQSTAPVSLGQSSQTQTLSIKHPACSWVLRSLAAAPSKQLMLLETAW
jgi:hypothetical protein